MLTSRDPPLRSRFQARVVMPPTTSSLLQDIMTRSPTLPVATAKKLVTFVEGIRIMSEEGGSGRGMAGATKVPLFPSHSLRVTSEILSTFDEEENLVRLLARSYPWIHSMMPDGSVDESMRSVLSKAVETYVDGGDVARKKKRVNHPYQFPKPSEYSDKIQFVRDEEVGGTRMTVDVGGGVVLKSRGGDQHVHSEEERMRSLSSHQHLVPLKMHVDVMLDMYQDHSFGCDLLVVGPKGCGKSALCKHFATTLGHSPVLFSMYKDMTARDLLQRRATDSAGNTIWEASPVVDAAINGDLVILDGLDRLSADTLSALQRLLVDREVELFDGTRLVSKRSEKDSSNTPFNVHPVHPSFRIVAVACPPTSANPWMTDEVVSWFRTTVLPAPDDHEILHMIRELHPEAPMETMEKAVHFSKLLRDRVQRKSDKSDKRAAGLSGLSLRQLLRLARHAHSFPKDAEASLPTRINNMLMAPYLPNAKRDVISEVMHASDLTLPTSSSLSSCPPSSSLQIVRTKTDLTIGDVTMKVRKPLRPEMVPNPIFYEIPSHTIALQSMMRDLVSGERHLLLLGPQGCGKNKLSDYLCHLLGREREYVQLHRDSTVGSLTLSPTLSDGQSDPVKQSNTRKATDYCLANPRWRLTLQMHKLIGID